jgi:threonine/homoserine/homoserine lactone efflux protein
MCLSPRASACLCLAHKGKVVIDEEGDCMYIEVFLVGLLAGMSPGPDFFVVLRNSLRFGRHIGVATAIGIGSALMIHITYTVLGFAFLLHQHPALFRLVQGLGALYLFWLG